METNAAVLHEMNLSRPYSESKPLKIERVKLREPGYNEVIVKVKAAGLCHSDLSVIDGNRPRPLPMVLGHEAAGEVIEIGPGVKRLEVGDHVVFSFMPSCGHCASCATGRAALCEPGAKANGAGTLLSGEIKIQNASGESYYHHLGVSGFAEYSVASVDSLVKIDREISFDVAALFGCAVITGVGATVNTGNVKLGDSVAVIGLGGVGLAAILGAKAAGAKKVIGIDMLANKREAALTMGADHVLDAGNPDVLEEIKDLTSGGVDVALEFAGAIPALELAFEACKRGGIAVTAALPHPDEKLSLSPAALVGMEKCIKGSYLGSCVPSRDIPNYLALFKAGRLPVDQLITHRMNLDQINEGFERLASGKAIRQIININ